MEKEWFVVTYRDKHGDFIVYDDRIKYITSSNQYSSIGRGFNTKEELIEKEKILDCNCKKCGNIIKTNWLPPYDTLLEKHQLCFGCMHWQTILNKMKDKRALIINGESYYVENDNPDSYFKGFGGKEFKIKRFDSDEIITTRNLWHQGDVPEIWKNDLPDNAEFIKENYDFKLDLDKLIENI